MKSTNKLFRGKRRGKRLVFVYTLSGRTLKVITDFAGEIILQHLTWCKIIQIYPFLIILSHFLETRKLTNFEFQNSKIERFRVLKLEN